MKIGICDNSPIYLKFFNELVNKHTPKANYRKLYTLTPDKLYLDIKSKSIPYDILILDVNLGNFNGIEFAREIHIINSKCIIIFISSYLHYATKVYDVDHIYFVLKTEAEARLPKALEKAFSLYYGRKSLYLSVCYKSINSQVPLSDIMYLEIFGRYLYVHTNDKTYKFIKSLKSVALELTEDFARCHNSYIVNLSHVLSFDRKSCKISTGSIVPISNTYFNCFQSLHKKFVSKIPN